MEVVEGTKKGALLLKVVEIIKASKSKLDESSIQDELDRQLQLKELEMEKSKVIDEISEGRERKRERERDSECELERARER